MSLDYHIYTSIGVYCLYLAFEQMQKTLLRYDYQYSFSKALTLPQWKRETKGRIHGLSGSH